MRRLKVVGEDNRARGRGAGEQMRPLESSSGGGGGPAVCSPGDQR
jgi:hypothetical protein